MCGHVSSCAVPMGVALLTGASLVWFLALFLLWLPALLITSGLCFITRYLLLGAVVPPLSDSSLSFVGDPPPVMRPATFLRPYWRLLAARDSRATVSFPLRPWFLFSYLIFSKVFPRISSRRAAGFFTLHTRRATLSFFTHCFGVLRVAASFLTLHRTCCVFR